MNSIRKNQQMKNSIFASMQSLQEHDDVDGDILKTADVAQ